MEEGVFRQTLDSVNPRPCAFEKAILIRCCSCPLARKLYVAEREMVSCNEARARENCIELLERLRQQSAFALNLAHVIPPLPHGQEVRVQCGGLKGLQLEMDGAEKVSDVFYLVASAQTKFGSFDKLPYSIIARSIVAYKTRNHPPEK